MAPLNGMNGTTANDVETPRDSATSHAVDGPDLKHNAIETTLVDTRTGKPVENPKEYAGVPPDQLPPHLKPSRVHFDHLGGRINTATHGGVKGKHLRAILVLGRIGWIAKAIVYSLIGGLCTRGAVSKDLNIDASPQGVFILIGKGAAGIYILIIMAVALATYIIWRFWEGITMQGSHPCYGKFTNIFRFRVSPLVSGAVYCAYTGYIIVLIPKAINYHNDAVSKSSGSDFTKSWKGSVIGRIGLVLVGLAFLAAVLVMLQAAFTKRFHRELRLKELRPWVKWLVLACGHLGALGRAGLFLLVSILMWRALDGDADNGGPNDKNTIGRAFSQLQTKAWGQTILFLIGFGLIIYGLFAVLCAYPAKIFPTPLPSQAEMGEMVRKREEKAAAKKRKQEEKQRVKDGTQSNAQILRDNHMPAAQSQPNGKPAIQPVQTGPNAV